MFDFAAVFKNSWNKVIWNFRVIDILKQNYSVNGFNLTVLMNVVYLKVGFIVQTIAQLLLGLNYTSIYSA